MMLYPPVWLCGKFIIVMQKKKKKNWKDVLKGRNEKVWIWSPKSEQSAVDHKIIVNQICKI